MQTLATWNVNSVRARLPRLLEWLDRRRPDVACLQETKCLDEAFPREALGDAGYVAATFGQKTYNGVAILSRSAPEEVVRGLGDEEFDREARVITARFGRLWVIDAYVVNGREVGTEHYAFKLRFLEALRRLAARLPGAGDALAVVGDFNVTFDDRDVGDPEAWREKILCSTPEREAMARLLGAGLADAFRRFERGAGHHTWWDFRTRGYQRGDGLRIDHVLLSPAALAACTGVVIDREAREGERPSDHAPVIATLAPGLLPPAG